MALYTDIVTGDELLNTYFDTKLIDDTVYEAEGRQITKTESNDFDIGANASAEGGDEDEGFDAANSTTVIDIVDNFRLQKMDGLFPKKKDFASHIKAWMEKALAPKLKEMGQSPEEIKVETDRIKAFCGKVVKDFDSWDFYAGESMDLEGGSLVLCHWAPGKSGEEAPIFYAFKAACKSQKI